MKVLILCNNAFVKGNGLCTAIHAFVSRLRGQGVDARLMAAVNADNDGAQPDFPLDHFKFPFFEPIIYANGFRYAKIQRKVIKEAVEWADIVHIQEAFPLEIAACNIARKLGKPVVGTFHLFPENVTANLGIGKLTFVSNLILALWRDTVFNKCSYIHCPTEFVRNHLASHKFTSKLRVFSNGIELPEADGPLGEVSYEAPYKILCIGRLSNEKDQKTLLKAMEYSSHSREIELHFAGKGPYMDKYKKIASELMRRGGLEHAPRFGFYTKQELAQLASHSFLYIHCAWAEVEGLSCLEALREGMVPVIAKGAMSATSQFALDERSIYPVYDARALADRIDWWIEHPEEHRRMRGEYARSVGQYGQKLCTDKLISMYREALGGE